MGQAPPKKDTQYLEDLLKKRLDYVKNLSTDLQCNKGVLAQTVASYSDILDGRSFSCDWPAQGNVIYFWRAMFTLVPYITVLTSESLEMCCAEIMTDIALQSHRAVRTGLVCTQQSGSLMHHNASQMRVPLDLSFDPMLRL